MLCKNRNDDIIEINNKSNNAHNDDDENIDYWIEVLQLTEEENVPHPNIWLNIQHFKKLCKYYILTNYNQWDMNKTIKQS